MGARHDPRNCGVPPRDAADRCCQVTARTVRKAISPRFDKPTVRTRAEAITKAREAGFGGAWAEHLRPEGPNRDARPGIRTPRRADPGPLPHDARRTRRDTDASSSQGALP